MADGLGSEFMHKVLFICSANVFRSLAAELAIRRELGAGSNITVESAGVFFKHEKPLREDVRMALLAQGLDPQLHRPREVTAEMLAGSSVVVAMAENHRIALREKFGVESILFNELAKGESTSVQDLIEVLPRFWESPDAAREFVNKTITEIVSAAANVARASPRILRPSLAPADESAVNRQQDLRP